MRTLPLIFLILFAAPVKAQNDSLAITETIHQFFQALRDGDTLHMKSLLHDSLVLGTTYRSKNDDAIIIYESPAKLIEAIGSKGDQKWNEVIFDLEIKYSGDLASAWMNYNFFVDDTFSHCGVNSFQLLRRLENWQIISIFDTRDKVNCNSEQK
jgi:hypothetical protein